MRRYHHSPSIPFLIANAQGVQEAAGSPVDGLKASGGIGGASAPQNASGPRFLSPRVFLWSLLVSGIAIGAGLALEIGGMMYQGLFVQALGFFVAGVAIILKPEGE